MGTLTITEILKLLKALKDVKQIKRKKNKKRRKKLNPYNNIKSTSEHMLGNNIITGEHLRSIQDNNELKMKLLTNELGSNNQSEINNLNNTINEMKYKTAFYLSDHHNKLNKLNGLASIYNQSLSRDNFQNYFNTNDNINVPYDSNIDNTFHIEANLPSTSQQENRTFSTEQEKTKPTNLTTNDSIFEEEKLEEEEEDNTNNVVVEDVPNEETKTNVGDIVEEEEDNTGGVVIEDVSDKEEMANLLKFYYNNDKFKDEYEANYFKKDGTYRNTPKRTDNKPNKNLKKRERDEIIRILNFYEKPEAAKSMANVTAKYTAYKILHQNFNL